MELRYASAMDSEQAEVGRYAPSPTGDLHLGNLRTAVIAWLHTRLQNGTFLLRIEDLDTPRCVPGSAEQILRDLEWLGLDWDGEVVYQSKRQSLYQVAMAELQDQQLLYPCFCSRKDIREASSAPHSAPGVYPGTCTSLTPREIDEKSALKPAATRIRVADEVVQFDDGCLGAQYQSLASEVGDFVIKRADGLFAYQLAVVVDDLEQGISSVVRGADLIDSAARQIYLFEKLGADAPHYWHVPLMLDEEGNRMAKRDGSESARAWRAAGKNGEQLVGKMAFDLTLVDREEAMSMSELLSLLDFESMTKCLRRMSKADQSRAGV
ncbi:MAG: tRNA glutamyl-Q(34) synthetase GluQRS [Pseudomonadota bacterium]